MFFTQAASAKINCKWPYLIEQVSLVLLMSAFDESGQASRRQN